MTLEVIHITVSAWFVRVVSVSERCHFAPPPAPGPQHPPPGPPTAGVRPVEIGECLLALGLGEPGGLSGFLGGEPHISDGAVIATRARDVVLHRAVVALNDVALGRVIPDV